MYKLKSNDTNIQINKYYIIKRVINERRYKIINNTKINKIKGNISHFIIIFLFFIILSKEKKITKFNLISEITITIKGSRNQNILSKNHTNIPIPDQILINGEIQDYTDKIVYNLTEEINNITMRWESQLTTCNDMFSGLSNITNIDLSKFDMSQVTQTISMFYGCNSLTSLDLSLCNNSPSLNDMSKMFKFCNSLKYINFTNFDTSHVINMDNLFYDCRALTSLDLDNFDTSSANNMGDMFNGCRSLTKLNLSNFNTVNVEWMGHMFFNCVSLKSLYLNNFNTGRVVYMDNMFKGCRSLLSLDLSNFSTASITSIDDMFNNCRSLKVLNIKNFELSSGASFERILDNCNKSLIYCIEEGAILEKMKESGFNNNQCSNICFNKDSKLIIGKGICIDNCFNDNINRFEYDNICYSICPEGTHNSSNSEFLCEKDLICEKYYNYNHTICLEYIPEGFYLNDSIKTIQKCNIKCNSCILESQKIELCVKCNINEGYYPKFKDDSNVNIFINCYNQTPHGYYLYNNIYMPLSLENNCYYDINTDIIQLKKICKNITFIEITPEIKKFLLNIFNLNEENDKLYLIIVENERYDSKIVTSNYDYKFILLNGTELNINNIKEDIYFNIYVPIKDLNSSHFNYSLYFAEQGYDIYDKKSNFYNDICTPTHLYNNDIILKDRKKDIYPNNVTLCKENCYYNGIIREEKRIICKCNLNINNKYNDINEEDFSIDDDNNFLSYLLDNINYEIFVCYRLFFSFDNLKKNISFYFILIISLIIMSFNLVFYFYMISKIKDLLYEVLPTPEKIKLETKKQIVRHKSFRENENILEPIKKIRKESENSNLNNQKSEINNINNQKPEFNINNQKSEIKITEKKGEQIIIYRHFDDDEEEDINELTYERAKYKDKRSIINIFVSIFLQKIDIINIIQSKYKLHFILFSQFLTLFIINIFFNTLLYSNEIISKKYHNNGELDFLVTLILTLLSNIITSIISFYLNYPKGIEDRIELIKEIKNEYYYIFNITKLIKYIKIKFIIFFICEIIILFICLYYISIFFIVYSFCKINLIINYITSSLESLLVSFIISIIIVLLRKIGLVYLNKNIYNVSKYLNEKF